jgi:hemerythrin
MILGHKLEHEKFVKKIEELLIEFRKGKISVSLKLSGFLKGWLVNHIMGIDQKYARHVRAIYNDNKINAA